MKIQYILPILVFAIFVTACTTQKKTSASGFVTNRVRIFNRDSGKYVLPNYFKDRLIWYKDSCIIQECLRVDINTDTSGVETWRVWVTHYTFTDLRKKAFYNYDTLKPEAVLLAKYTQPDSVTVTGGWNFYAYHNIMPTQKSTSLPDTLIHEVNYKRLRWDFKETINKDEKEFIYIAYMRCDKKKTIVHYDRRFDETHECPLVMFEFVAVGKQPWMKEENEYTRDYLTPYEQQVFTAWERNARLNPVTAADTLKHK